MRNQYETLQSVRRQIWLCLYKGFAKDESVKRRMTPPGTKTAGCENSPSAAPGQHLLASLAYKSFLPGLQHVGIDDDTTFLGVLVNDDARFTLS